jgi:ketosteroid isomerase-like protein
MKPAIIVILFFSFLVGCAREEPVQMTAQEQETIKNEIRQVVNQILAATNKMDVDALLQPYWDSPEFLLVSAQGAMADYQTAKNGSAELFKVLDSLQYTTVRDEFRILSGTTVLYTWLGKCECAFKAGGKATIESYAITFLLRKMDSNWKIVYAHESASLPIE